MVGPRERTTIANTGQWGARTRRIVLALACSACMVLGSPDHDLWWLGFFGWVPWMFAIDGLGPGRAFLYGWLCGTVTVYWGFLWLNQLLVKFASFPPLVAFPIHVLFGAWQGLQWAIPAALLAWFSRRRRIPSLWLAPLCWVAVEATLPSIFPAYMAFMWCWQPLWIQAAELGGITTVSFSMLAINAALYALVRRWLRERRLDRTAAIALGAWLVAIPSYGAIRIAQTERMMASTETLRIGVVQGNYSIRQMATLGLRREIVETHQRESAELDRRGAELIVWGETAYPNPRAFRRDTRTDLPENHPLKVMRGFDLPLVFGAVTSEARNPYPWNTALVLHPDGSVGDRYDKVYLLVFGEYIPIVDPEWFLELVPAAAHLERGIGPGVLRIDGYRLGPLICYEDILPRFTRDIARQGVHVFVNLTNDAWFGLTKEPAQHLGLAVFRTIEHRRAMVRAVNTGVSAYIDPTGRVQHQTQVTDPDEQGPQPPSSFIADVPMIEPGTATTPYFLTGELFNALVLLALVILGVKARWANETGAARDGRESISQLGSSVIGLTTRDRAIHEPPS